MELHSDQGRNLEAALMKDVCRILGIKKTRTTAFRPQGDGFIERFNRTVQNMMSMYVKESQTDWDQVLPLVVSAYRATPQETTGQSPNLMMLGREVMMPVDLVAGQPPGEDPMENTEYGAKLRENLEKIHRMAREKSGREMSRQKKLYDRGKVEERYKRGDRVWEATSRRFKGRSPKLQKRWKGPRIVLKQCSDVTYLVGAGLRTVPKVVHFDRLKPYGGVIRPRWMDVLLREFPEDGDTKSRPAPGAGQVADSGGRATVEVTHDDGSGPSDDDQANETDEETDSDLDQ